MTINHYLDIFPSLRNRTSLPAASLLQHFEAIYGTEARAIHAQIQRYTRVLQMYRDHYGDQEVSIVHAPGRVDLMGSHTDYHQGFVLPMALDKDIITIAGKRPDQSMRMQNINHNNFPEFDFTLAADIPQSPRGEWSNYVKAGAQAFVQKFGLERLNGMNAIIDGLPPYGVPLAAGLSSSSALLISAACAFRAVNNIDMDGKPFARFCGEAEWYVGTRGGFMDHFASILNQRDHALFMDCRPVQQEDGHETFLTENIPLPSGYDVLVCNTHVQKEKSASADYNTRALELKLGVELLKSQFPKAHYLRDIPIDTPLQEMLPATITIDELRKRLTPSGLDALLQDYNLAPSRELHILTRCRHVLSENARVLDGCECLKTGDMPGFGTLMTASYQSFRDDFDGSCPELDTMIGIALKLPGTAGARIAGAGWGGCAVVIVESSASQAFQAELAERYLQATGRTASIFACHPGQGAGVLVSPD